MNKGMRSMALILAIASTASALSSCSDDTYSYPDYSWRDGLVAVIGGREYEYSEIYDLMQGERDSAESLYNTASDIVAQLATPITDSMRVDVEGDISDLQESWRTAADTNGTSYREEMENALEEQGVDDIDELRLKLLSEQQTAENSTNFYNDNYGNYKGTDDALYHISENKTKEFVEEERPYHISHILVRVDASGASSDAAAYYDGHISSGNATKLSQVVRQLSSTSSFGSVAQVFSDDSADKYGELGGSGSGGSAVGMALSTSYVNEFKLGVYAYDKYLNPELSQEAKDQLSVDARVPGTTGVDSDITNAIALESTDIANGKAYGIPLSVALTIGQVANQESADSGINVSYTDATQYPRNILFNNYFNNHAVSFIYDDSDTYEASFVESINTAYGTNYTSASEVQNDYPDRYNEYLRVSTQLSAISSSKFIEVNGVSDNLITYQSTYSYSGSTPVSASTSVVDVNGSKKVLSDGNGNPIIIVRSGTGDSDSGYEGIHFITVNHDPYDDMANDYEYWRVNIPTSTGTGAESDNYSQEPSYVNFVNSDPGNNSTYQTRIDSVKSAVAGFDANIGYDLFETNIETVAQNLNIPGTDVDDWGSALFGEYWGTISLFIQYNRETTKTSSDDTLDESWDTYLNVLNLQKDIVPSRLVPTVCVSYFQSGSYPNEQVEAMCHVER